MWAWDQLPMKLFKKEQGDMGTIVIEIFCNVGGELIGFRERVITGYTFTGEIEWRPVGEFEKEFKDFEYLQDGRDPSTE